MNNRKSLLSAVFAWLHNEVDASPLEAYQRVGSIVFERLIAGQLLYQELIAQGLDRWTIPVHYQLQQLCLWNAFVLQTLGDQLLQTDYRFKPLTIGYVPALVGKQTQYFYQPVETWLNKAQQAQINPLYDTNSINTELPSLLPTWLSLNEIFPKEKDSKSRLYYLEGLLAAAKTIVLALDQRMSDVQFDEKHIADTHKFQQLHHQINHSLEYTIQLWGEQLTISLMPTVEQNLRRIVLQSYLLGQSLAMPSLVDKISSRAIQANQPLHNAATHQHNTLDIWCLTAASAKQQKISRLSEQQLLKNMWQQDQNQRYTLAIYQFLQQALAKGDIAYAQHQNSDFFNQCPWSPIFISQHPIVIAGDPLRANQLFTYVCNVDDVNELLPPNFGNRILRL